MALGKTALMSTLSLALFRVKGLYALPFLSKAFYDCFYDTAEKNVVSSDLIKELSLKYKFSTFDFHDSKRSS